MNKISKKLNKHYDATFKKYGATSKGVDWGDNECNLELRYKNMLNLIKGKTDIGSSLLDVGCGFGGLLKYSLVNSVKLEYTGIDVSEPMIDWANSNNDKGEFIVGDILDNNEKEKYDYVVCNGILTQKLDVTMKEMDVFSNKLIKTMFRLAKKGIAFNIMTTRVNFFSDNLYYKSPAEMLAWCMLEISPYIKIDHSYPMYEYTVYIYKEPL